MTPEEQIITSASTPLPKRKYKDGELVRFIDGDGRPHQVRYARWMIPMHGEGYWEYQLEGNRHSMESSLKPFIDVVLISNICMWLRGNLRPYMRNSVDNFSVQMLISKLYEEFTGEKMPVPEPTPKQSWLRKQINKYIDKHYFKK